MNKSIYLICLIAISGTSCSLLKPRVSDSKLSNLSHQGYKLVWSDEFSGSELDSNNWGYETGPSWYNSEQQAYTDKNVTVKDGMLVIEAKKDNYPNQNDSERYTSSRLLTQGKQSWKYGIFEARLKRPKGEGSFPAFWMMGNSYSRQAGNWPACGEIGIVEFLHTEDENSWSKAITNLHYGATFKQHKALDGVSVAPSMSDISDDFHTYTFEWTPTTMTWYLDGQVVKDGVVEYTQLPGYNQEFNAQKFFFLFSFAVGFDMYAGSVTGNPDNTTWPKQLVVDWIRVYQK